MEAGSYVLGPPDWRPLSPRLPRAGDSPATASPRPIGVDRPGARAALSLRREMFHPAADRPSLAPDRTV